MASACVIKPSVITKDGNQRESRLFNDLLSFYGKDKRNEVKSVYNKLTSPQYMSNIPDGMKLDDAGQVILSSAINNNATRGIMDEAIIVDGISRSIGAVKNGSRVLMEDTTDNYLKLSKDISEFNSSSEYRNRYVALITNEEDGKIAISISVANDNNLAIAKKIEINRILNEKIRTILPQMGVTIDALNNLQDNLRENGIVDYENATETAKGFINLIKIANGSKGEQALPEEFAHLMVDVMQDEPMVKRLISTVSPIIEEILGDEYDAYVERYQGDNDRLLREAAGKLVYRELTGDGVQAKKYRSFIDRAIDSIKNFILRTFHAKPLADAMYSAEMAAQGFANRILNENKVQKIQKEKLKGLSNLSQLASNAKSSASILQDSIDKSLKKYSFYVESLEQMIRKAPEQANGSNVKTKQQLQDKLDRYKSDAQAYIGELNTEMRGRHYNLGIERFIEKTAFELQAVSDRLNECINGDLDIREKAYNLRNCKNITDSVRSTVNDIIVAMNSNDSDLELSESARQQFETVVKKLSIADTNIANQSLLTFADYLKRFFKHTIEINESNGNKRIISKDDIEQLLQTATSDIGLANTWLESAAESNDIIIKLTDQALKASKERKRQRVVAIRKRLQAAAKALPSRNTDFMFERHADGTMSSRYISSINWTKYKDAEAAMLKSLNEKYGANAKGEDARKKIEERNAWRRENQNAYGEPDRTKYGVDVEDLLTKEQYEYYKEFMSIRDELLEYLPSNIYKNDPYKAVQIRKDLWERIKSSSPTAWLSQITTDAKQALITNVDDTEFGKYRTNTDFEGREIFSVPIFFTNDVAESELTRDTVSTLAAFADMAINYDEMTEIADYLELGRDVMEKRDAKIEKNGTSLKDNFKALGQKVSSYAKADSNNFVTRYNELLKSQFYGRYMNDGVLISGKDWEIKSNKFARVLNKISSLNQLALNGLAGFAAVANDMLNVESEALAGQYFKHRHILKADGIYRKELAGILGETGNPIKSSKLGLFIEMFDVLHEYDNDIRDMEWDKSRTKKLLSENSLYFFMHAGSHWGETRTALAQALAAEITSDDGKEKSNLWDILEKKPIDAKHPERGYKLVPKDGYTLTEEDITRYTRRFMGLNERLFGAYNLADRNALQSTAIGQLIFLYRKFMVPAIERRFKKGDYNLDLDQETEGYYRTVWNFLGSLGREARSLSDIIKMYNEDLTDNQRANIARAANELSVFLVLSVIVGLVTHADWNKKDNPWHRRFIAYMSRRMRTEAGAFTPFGVTGELWQILKSPAASIKTLESFGDIIGVLNPFNYELMGGEDAIVKSGRYKGHSRAYKSFFNSPLLPMNKTVYKMFHPEESLIAFR